MPKNDYQCHDCNLVFEARVGTDGPRPTCPYCDGPNVSWRPAAISVRFKGKGWTEKFYGKEKKDES